ncbi:MAG: dipeptide epimerase [Euryarchaeota archaeon]|nr:dipeptide epimerase [Euryarchaeota archaeon]
MPVCQLLGSCRESIETSMTIGIADPESTARKSIASVQAGFKALKIKIGLDLDGDLKRVEAVRDAVGPGVKLRVDCNQGFDREGAKRLVKALAPLSLEFVEQPVPAGDWTSLREVTEMSPIPIMADESVKTMDDLLRLVRGRYANMFNLKLSKCGGIYPAAGMTKLCEAAEIKVQVGCMAECQAAIAGGLHLALSQRAVAYADLDSHFSFENDPTRAVEFRAGRLHPRKGPGLGVEFVTPP